MEVLCRLSTAADRLDLYVHILPYAQVAAADSAPHAQQQPSTDTAPCMAPTMIAMAARCHIHTRAAPTSGTHTTFWYVQPQRVVVEGALLQCLLEQNTAPALGTMYR